MYLRLGRHLRLRLQPRLWQLRRCGRRRRSVRRRRDPAHHPRIDRPLPLLSPLPLSMLMPPHRVAIPNISMLLPSHNGLPVRLRHPRSRCCSHSHSCRRMRLLGPDGLLRRTNRSGVVHQRPRLLNTFVIEHERTRALLQHALDPALLHRVVADPQPSAPRPRPRVILPVLVADRSLRQALRAVAPKGALRAWRGVAAVAGGGGPGLAAEADVVAEGVLAVVADDGGEAVERAGHCVGRRCRRD